MTTLKTLPIGISPAKYTDGKIIIGGCCFNDLNHPIYDNDFPNIDDGCLVKAIGLETEFIYSAFCFCDNEQQPGEVGIGRLVKEGDTVYLNRESVLFHQNNLSGRRRSLDGEIVEGFFEEDAPLLISTFQTEALDSHLIENTLFYNGGYVQLTEEGVLCSINGHITKLRPQDLVKFISKSSANISTGPITIKPLKNRPSKAKKGTIVFNEITSKLEVYDGTEWKIVKWED